CRAGPLPLQSFAPEPGCPPVPPDARNAVTRTRRLPWPPGSYRPRVPQEPNTASRPGLQRSSTVRSNASSSFATSVFLRGQLGGIGPLQRVDGLQAGFRGPQAQTDSAVTRLQQLVTTGDQRATRNQHQCVFEKQPAKPFEESLHDCPPSRIRVLKASSRNRDRASCS